MIKLLVILPFAFSANAAVTVDEPCPEVKAVDNFNLEAFTQGKWYEIARYPNLFEERADCVTFHYDKEDDDNYKVQLTDIVDHNKKFLEAYLSIDPKANNTGVLNYHLTKNKDSQAVVGYILDTDNLNYQISYQCLYDGENKRRTEFAWIGSRTKILNDAAKAAVNKFLENSKVINTKKLVYNHFTDDFCSIKA